MNTATRLTKLALAFNIIVLVPVLLALMIQLPQTEQSFGPATAGRSILISIYLAIVLVSAALIVMHLKRLAWATPMSVALFAVQITYKLITVPMVGLANPVVVSNLVVVAVQSVALFTLWQAFQRSSLRD